MVAEDPGQIAQVSLEQLVRPLCGLPYLDIPSIRPFNPLPHVMCECKIVVTNTSQIRHNGTGSHEHPNDLALHSKMARNADA
jgi:hypothetical protein